MTVHSLFPEDSWPARRNDPLTSWKSARINQRYRNGQRFALLLAHARVGNRDPLYDGLSADQCAIAANLPVPCNGGTSKACYWKRHSELWRDFGYLEPVYRHGVLATFRIPVPGAEEQMILRIHLRGLDHVDDVLRRFPRST
jgi:hypothetical protein